MRAQRESSRPNRMELYYKDLISAEASLDKLVDDLMLVVQGANEFAAANGIKLRHEEQQEIAGRLERLKEGCRRIREQSIATALAADKLLHEYPYSAAGFAFAAGLLAGALLRRRNS
jgi:ElaB/YqjD/DUF883 family membrane-anchored ribosome-binding protein